MPSSDHPDPDETLSLPQDGDETSPAGEAAGGDQALPEANDGDSKTEAEEEKLHLQVDIEPTSTCERHIVVTIPRKDIERYYEKEFAELATSAQLPGFRPGHAPRRLVEHRFRKEIKDKVKMSLLTDSIGQISDEYDLSAISEPDFDLDAVALPDDGPMTYEFNLEVRPEFDVPNWKGLQIEKPVREFTDQDVDRALQNLLAQHGKLVPYDGPADVGDYLSTKLTFTHEGQVLSASDEELIRIRPVLSFRDGKIENFDDLMKGVRAGETRVAEAQLSQEAPNEALRGKTVTATFEIQEVKKLELPELTSEFLTALGDFGSEADLRDAIGDNLERQLQYQQHRRAREQITNSLILGADWELPPALLKRQSERELQRAVMELQSAGFSDDEIRAHLNTLRQHSNRETARALKEHFILEKIAEEEKIEDQPEDYEYEIRRIAWQSGESPRRVRARLEKAGRMDVLRNQIIERKVIDLILSHATFTEVPYRPEGVDEEAVDRAAGGGEPESEIPEAKPEA